MCLLSLMSCSGCLEMSWFQKLISCWSIDYFASFLYTRSRTILLTGKLKFTARKMCFFYGCGCLLKFLKQRKINQIECFFCFLNFKRWHVYKEQWFHFQLHSCVFLFDCFLENHSRFSKDQRWRSSWSGLRTGSVCLGWTAEGSWPDSNKMFWLKSHPHCLCIWWGLFA